MTADENKLAVQDWAERLALEHMRDRDREFDGIKEQGRHLLALLLTVGGGAFGLFFHQIAKAHGNSPLTWGAITLAVYLYVLGALIILKVLRARPFPAVTNTPRATNQPEHSLFDLRGAELNNLQGRIVEATQISEDAARWLYRLQLALVGAPLGFGLPYGMATILPHLCGGVA